MTATTPFQRQLASDCPDTAERRAQAGRVFAERVFVTGRTRLLVPVALDRPADAMRLLTVTSLSGRRSFGVGFSLS